jgi:hypothetical protein
MLVSCACDVDDGLCGDDTLFYLIDNTVLAWYIYRLVIYIYIKKPCLSYSSIERGGISPSSNMRIYSSSVVQVEKKQVWRLAFEIFGKGLACYHICFMCLCNVYFTRCTLLYFTLSLSLSLFTYDTKQQMKMKLLYSTIVLRSIERERNVIEWNGVILWQIGCFSKSIKKGR